MLSRSKSIQKEINGRKPRGTPTVSVARDVKAVSVVEQRCCDVALGLPRARHDGREFAVLVGS